MEVLSILSFREVPELLVSIFVPLEDLLDGPEQSLEGAPVNRHNSGVSQDFDAGLSGDIPHQSDLPEVVTLFVLVHHFVLAG